MTRTKPPAMILKTFASLYFSVLMSLGGAPLSGCKSTQVATRQPEFLDDMTAFRPTAPALSRRPEDRAPTGQPDAPTVAPTHQVNEEIDQKMAAFAERNREIRYARGYRIQVYAGTQRAEAMAAREQLLRNFPDLEVYLNYTMPRFYLKAGDFTGRIDSQTWLARVREVFPNAFLVEEQINLPQSDG